MSNEKVVPIPLTDHDKAIRYIRSLMCTPLGREICEEQIMRPFGYEYVGRPEDESTRDH